MRVQKYSKKCGRDLGDHENIPEAEPELDAVYVLSR